MKLKISEHFECQDVNFVYSADISQEKNLDNIRLKMYTKLSSYNGFIIAVKSELGRPFAVFVPIQFHRTRTVYTFK